MKEAFFLEFVSLTFTSHEWIVGGKSSMKKKALLTVAHFKLHTEILAFRKLWIATRGQLDGLFRLLLFL